jgi:hypothetical protein
LNGTKGNVYDGKLAMMDAGEENQVLMSFLKMCDVSRKLGIVPTPIHRPMRLRPGSSGPKASGVPY